MPSLVIASYLWFDPDGRHNADHIYTRDDVLRWRDMVDANLTVPHEFVCITDNEPQFDGTGIRTAPLAPGLPLKGFYQQLAPFSPDAGDVLGERILTMDLDCLVVGNMDAIASREEDLVLWRNPTRQPWAYPQYPDQRTGAMRSPYNLSIMLYRAGSRPEIWDDLCNQSQATTLSQKYLAKLVGPKCPYWDDKDGIYRLAREDTPGSGITGDLPDNACIVFFVGSEHKPWRADIQEKFPWIANNYRRAA